MLLIGVIPLIIILIIILHVQLWITVTRLNGFTPTMSGSVSGCETSRSSIVHPRKKPLIPNTARKAIPCTSFPTGWKRISRTAALTWSPDTGGAGKSSFVNYTINELNKKDPGNTQYIPISISLGQENMQEIEILRILAKNLKNKLEDGRSWWMKVVWDFTFIS